MSLMISRHFCGDSLDGVTDNAVYLTLQYFVQRVRNYAHVETLFAAEIDYAHVLGDGCSCRDRDRQIFIEAAKLNMDWFQTLTHWEFSEKVYGKDWGFPPFNIYCSCRMEGVIPGVDY